MAIVLHYMGCEVYEVLRVLDGGNTLVVGALWPDPAMRGREFVARKEDLRKVGYKPMEVEDAVVAKLRP